MNNYQWIWQGKAIPLEKLHITQLNSINKTLIKHKGSNWFNIDSSDWRVAIKQELEKRRISALITKEFSKKGKNSIIIKKAFKELNKLKPYKSCISSILHKK